MRASERENERYRRGADNPIDLEEKIMFSLLPESGFLLDIGCGVGTIGLHLRDMGFDYTGVDFSEVAVEKATQKGLNALVSDIDADGIKFPDEVFDVVWAGDVLEHVFDPLNMLYHVTRVLKPAGCLLLTVPNDFNFFSRVNIFLTGRSTQSNTYRRLQQCKHHTAFSWELLKFMLDESGLHVSQYRSILKFPKCSREIIVQNKVLGLLFGKVFIIKAKRK